MGIVGKELTVSDAVIALMRKGVNFESKGRPITHPRQIAELEVKEPNASMDIEKASLGNKTWGKIDFLRKKGFSITGLIDYEDNCKKGKVTDTQRTLRFETRSKVQPKKKR